MMEEEKIPESEQQAEETTPNRNAAAIRQYLDTEESRTRRARHAHTSGTMAGRQTVIIAVMLSILLVGGILYFAILRPLAEKKPETQGPVNTVSLLEGESRTEYGALTMFEIIRSPQIESLFIQNEKDNWGFVYDSEKEIFYIEDYKKIYSICDSNTWVTLVHQFGTAQVSNRVEDGSTPIDYSKYGLGEENETVSCTIKTKDGHTRVITVGAQTATGSGYYATASYDGERREAVYIVNTVMADCCNLTKLDLISPLVTIPFDESDYIPDRMIIRHEGKPYVDIRLLTESEAAATESAKTTRVVTANGLEYNASVQYSTMLYDVLRKGINGSRVVAVSADDKELSPKELAEWGITVPSEDGTGSAPYIDLYIQKSKMLNQNLLFSPKTEQNTYYVYVMVFDMVVEMPSAVMEFIEWDEKKFIEASIYLMSIYNVTEMTVDSTALPDAYVAAGIPRVNETFRLTSRLTTAADGSDTYLLEDVRIASTGEPVPAPVGNSKLTGIANFKHYFMVLMTISAQLDIPEDIRDQLDPDKPDVTITVKTIREQTHTLRFYFYNSRHAFYTLDGEGQFYVVYDELTKFLTDTVSVVNGEYVDWESKNNSGVDVDSSGNGQVKPSVPEKPTEESKIPTGTVTIIVIAAVLVVGGVGGFAIYAAVMQKKKKESDDE